MYAPTVIETALTLPMVLALHCARPRVAALAVQAARAGHPGSRPHDAQRPRQEAGQDPAGRRQRHRRASSAVDSTGLSVPTGNQRKRPNERSGRKLHIAMDADTRQIAAVELTASATHDSALVPKFLKSRHRSVSSFITDGADDSKPVNNAVAQHACRHGRPSRDGACAVT